MKIKKALIAGGMAFTLLFSATSCKLDLDNSNSYNVTLNCNGGTVENLTSYKEGEGARLPKPQREYYDFGGWYEDFTFNGDETTSISATATGDKTYYAKWVPKIYEVTFNTDGGTLSSTLINYTYGNGAALPNATKIGHDFGGWYDNSALSGSAIASIFATDHGDKTYYAKWTASTYSVTLNLNGGSVVSDITSYTYGQSVNLPVPEKAKNDFDGWYSNATFTGSKVTSISATDIGDKQFWAKWEPKHEEQPKPPTPPVEVKHNVTLNVNGGSLETSLSQFVEGEGATLPVPTKVGHTFKGWYEKADFSGTAVTAISATDKQDKTFYAKWEANKYNLTYNWNGGNIPPAYSKDYTYGMVTMLPSPTKEGYDFAGWCEKSDLSDTAIKQLSNAQGDKTFYAKWTPKTYNLTLKLEGGTLANAPTSYTYGKELSLPDPQKTGCVFDGWYDASNKLFTKISATDIGDITLTAKWSPETTDNLSIISSGGYEEGAYIEVNTLSGVNSYKISYKASGASDFTKIDDQLVRIGSDSVRADIVGISAGSYTLKVEAGGKSITKDVTVTAYDRSGYAHFKATESIGAYNSDGTPKSNAIIVYFNEANKNDDVTVNGNTYKGIVGLLTNSSEITVNAKKPLIVRVIGQIAAATWSEIKYTKTSTNTYKDGTLLKATVIKGNNGKQLPTGTKDIYQADLIKGGYNTLDTSKYSELLGLTSKATWKAGSTSEQDEYDSAWNNCSIVGTKNVTLEGIGTDAELFQWGLTWKNCNSIEVRNLTFDDYTEDACSFEGSSTSCTDINKFDSQRLWIHHNVFNEGINYWDVCPEQDKHEGDGATDFKGVSYVTIAYNKYYKNHKTGLIGGSDTQTTANVTFHHNYYLQCNSRLPLARRANMHMYNNYYCGSTGTNMSIRAGGYAYIEYCYFDNANNPITTQVYNEKDKAGNVIKVWKGVVKYYECKFDGKQIGSDYSATVIKVTDRTKVVANDNQFGQTFDTDPNAFYYDATNKKSNVTNLITTLSSVKTEIPKLAGVHK